MDVREKKACKESLRGKELMFLNFVVAEDSRVP